MSGSFFSQAQRVGRSLMLPVATLPAAGLMLGIGNFGAQGHLFLPPSFWSVLMVSGDWIFGNMPLLFLIGIAIGLARNNDGTAALAAVVGFITMNAALGKTVVLRGLETNTEVLSIPTLNMGILGSILMGSLAAYFFNRFHTLKLPEYLGFFAGKRFVPIITGFSGIFLGVMLGFIWPVVGSAIFEFTAYLGTLNKSVTFGLYGLVERALIPTGLHHIWNAFFFNELGSWTNPQTGEVVTGELVRFFKGDPSAGGLAGGYMYSMWALPAAALAIYRCASLEKRKLVGGLMLSAAFTSWLTGITEPVEFAFLFVAPMLYVIHTLLTGVAFALTNYLGIVHSTDFAHGALQFFLYLNLPQTHNTWWFLIIGPLWALLYFSLFSFLIRKFDLKTPGRESQPLQAVDIKEQDELALDLVEAMGGAANIVHLDACITRLRVSLHDIKLADIPRIKALGAIDVLVVGNNLQAIFGTRSDNIKTDMSAALAV